MTCKNRCTLHLLLEAVPEIVAAQHHDSDMAQQVEQISEAAFNKVVASRSEHS